jgi:hypothetical protein
LDGADVSRNFQLLGHTHTLHTIRLLRRLIILSLIQRSRRREREAEKGGEVNRSKRLEAGREKERSIEHLQNKRMADGIGS